jgi:hypothetical protein
MVKDNQRLLVRKVEALLSGSNLFETVVRQAQTLDPRRRGRIETRTITVASCPSRAVDLSVYTGFAGVQQVFRLERRTVCKRTGVLLHQQTVLGITSLSPQSEQGQPETLLTLQRGHWHIENRSHYVRDVTFGEDKSQVRVGNLPQVLAALRNAAIALIRLAGHASVAAACRFYAARPHQAVKLIKICRTE